MNQQVYTPRQPDMTREAKWNLYVIADLMTWATNAEERSPLEEFKSFEEAKARFLELRMQSYNNQMFELNPDGEPYARLTLGITRTDGRVAVDLLHVRRGMNYLVDDFSRMENVYSDTEAMLIISRIAEEIGFEMVRRYAKTAVGYKRLPDVSIYDWESPFKPKLFYSTKRFNSFKVTVPFSVVLTQTDIDDIMCTALDGGITYWCKYAEVVGEFLGNMASEQISRGGALKLYDAESDETYELTLIKFLRGFQQYLEEANQISRDASGHMNMDDIDADAADIIIQYAIFSEMVYG